MEFQDLETISLNTQPEDFFYYPQTEKTQNDQTAVAFWTELHEAAKSLVDLINHQDTGLTAEPYPKDPLVILLKQRVQELDGLLENRQSASQVLMALANLMQVLNYLCQKQVETTKTKLFFQEANKIFEKYRVAWKNYQMPAFSEIGDKKFAYQHNESQYIVSSVTNQFPEQHQIKPSQPSIEIIGKIYQAYCAGQDYSELLANLRGDHREIKTERVIEIIQVLTQYVNANLKTQGQRIMEIVAIVLSHCLPRWTWTWSANDQDYAYEKALKWLSADVSMQNVETSNFKIFTDFLLVVNFSGENPKLQVALIELFNGLADQFFCLPMNSQIVDQMGKFKLPKVAFNPLKFVNLQAKEKTLVLQVELLRVLYAFRSTINVVTLAKASVEDFFAEKNNPDATIYRLLRSIIERASFQELLENLKRVSELKLENSHPGFAMCEQFKAIFKLYGKNSQQTEKKQQTTLFQENLYQALKNAKPLMTNLTDEAISKLGELIAVVNSGAYSDMYCRQLLIRFLKTNDMKSIEKNLLRDFATQNKLKPAFTQELKTETSQSSVQLSDSQNVLKNQPFFKQNSALQPLSLPPRKMSSNPIKPPIKNNYKDQAEKDPLLDILKGIDVPKVNPKKVPNPKKVSNPKKIPMKNPSKKFFKQAEKQTGNNQTPVKQRQMIEDKQMVNTPSPIKLDKNINQDILPQGWLYVCLVGNDQQPVQIYSHGNGNYDRLKPNSTEEYEVVNSSAIASWYNTEKNEWQDFNQSDNQEEISENFGSVLPTMPNQTNTNHGAQPEIKQNAFNPQSNQN